MVLDLSSSPTFISPTMTGRQKVYAQPGKVQALARPIKSKDKGLQGYLGQTIHHPLCFLSSPLTVLLKMGQPKQLCWTLKDLRTALGTKSVLQVVQLGYPFFLFTDAFDGPTTKTEPGRVKE